MAYDLISGIDKSKVTLAGSEKVNKKLDYLQKAYGYYKTKRVRIAVWPFDADSLPMAPQVASEFNDQLYGALIKNAGGRYDFIARNTLIALIHDMEQTGALEDAERNPLPALMENVRNVDVLIVGRLRIKSSGVRISYTATHVDGRVIASTGPHDLDIGPVERGHVSLDQAVRAAARNLADGAHDMNELRLGGIRFEDTGLQPPFGLRFRDLLSTEMARRINSAISDRRLKLKELGTPDASGISIKANKLSDYQLGAKPGSYLLTGTYWDLGDEVEVRVKLQDGDGGTILWVGRIKREEIGHTRLTPESDFSSLRQSDGGPILFQLKTDRGSDPVYHFGEKMNLILRVGRDAWVYCFYIQSNRKIIQILPNPYFWRYLKEPKFAGGVLHTVPGKKIFPFDLEISSPVGAELVKCFATSRDVTKDLPIALRGNSLEPLAKGTAYGLAKIFRNIPETIVSEASLAVTVIASK